MKSEIDTYFEIKDSGNFIRIEVNRLNYPNAKLQWDRNWLDSIVKVKTGAFSGKFKADLMTTDFLIFKKELGILYNNLKGFASFTTLENQIIIKISGDGIGHLQADCELMDYAGINGNKLIFSLDFDQTIIPEILNQLEDIMNKFPVKEKI